MSEGRLSDTPWRGRPIKPERIPSNAQKQALARSRMGRIETLTGMTEAELEAFHAEQRARVRARYGIR